MNLKAKYMWEDNIQTDFLPEIWCHGMALV